MKKKYRFIIYCLALVIIRQILVSHIPINALSLAGCDDQLMVLLSTNMLKFDYLGAFNYLTFVKGISFPLFLAGNTALGISYIGAVNLLYSIACLVFMYAIKDLIKKPWLKYVIFAILLFNPIMFANEVVQRVYRNSLTPAQVILIMSFMFMLFQSRKDKLNKKFVLISILEGLTLLFFYNTREDSIWIMPFMIVFIFIMVFGYIITNKKKTSIPKLIFMVLPLIILFLGNTAIKLVNYKYYGVYTRVDEEGTPFAECMKTLYSVKNDDEIEYVTMSRAKLDKIYEVSPTLASIKDNIDLHIGIFEQSDRKPGDNEVEDGWFWWVLRFAVNDAGYYKDAKTADEFYQKVIDEINKAFDEGKLEKQSTMPSALMSPWKKGYTGKLFKTMLEVVAYTNTYDKVETLVIESSGLDKNISYFESATNNKAIYPTKTKLNGYYTYDKDDYTFTIVNQSNDVIYKKECAKKEACSINFDTNVSKNDIKLVVYTKSSEIENKYLDYENNISDNYNLYLDSNYEANNVQKQVAGVYAKKLNIIAKVYKIVTPILSVLGIISYLVLIIRTIKDRKEYMDKFLIVTSIFLSYIVLITGVSYNHISSCFSISYMYLSGAYPLILMFDIISIGLLFKNNKKQD